MGWYLKSAGKVKQLDGSYKLMQAGDRVPDETVATWADRDVWVEERKDKGATEPEPRKPAKPEPEKEPEKKPFFGKKHAKKKGKK